MLSYMVHNNLKSGNRIWTFIITLNKRHTSNMAKLYNTRWAFNTKNWVPREEEIVAASTYIQCEEKLRISKFVFQNDAKSSLIGRLMLRKFIHLSTLIPYEDICLGRDGHGKPILCNESNVKSSFNVSHQGDFVVLGGNTQNDIGVDVMKIEPPADKDISEFFRIMKRQFSPKEWEMIRSYPTETEQIASFYRHWCLKESYVKNTGFGITVNLAEMSFDVKTRYLNIGDIVKDTILYCKDTLKTDWVFEETMLDDKHAVAVALKIEEKSDESPVSYEYLSFKDLVAEAKPIGKPDHGFKDNFMKKGIKKC